MLPETGTVEEFREAVFEVCTAWPVIDEVYRVAAGFPNEVYGFKLVPQNMLIVDVNRASITMVPYPLKPTTFRVNFSVEDWFVERRLGTITFEGYAT